MFIVSHMCIEVMVVPYFVLFILMKPKIILRIFLFLFFNLSSGIFYLSQAFRCLQAVRSNDCAELLYSVLSFLKDTDRLL